MPTLLELEARFMKHTVGLADEGHGRKLPDGSTQWGGFEVDTFVRVESLAEAQGIWFDCPLCWAEWKKGAARGPHGILIWFEGRGVPEHLGLNSSGKAVRWQVGGTGLGDLQLRPSILLQGGCNWHGFVGVEGRKPGEAW